MNSSTRRAITALCIVLVLCGKAAVAGAQDTEPTTRTAAIEQEKAKKSTELKPYEPNKVEEWIDRAEDLMLSGQLHWHPFFQNAYSGGGFTLGAGYMRHVSPYNFFDVRGSITFSGYKRIEAEFVAPRLFNRRGRLSAIGGWREATQVGFYGFGTGSTSKDDRANYSFKQPYAGATLDFWPTRRLWMLQGGVDVSQWDQGPGEGTFPSVEEKYTPATLPGLGASPTYVHSHGTLALDSRASPGYARRGSYLGVTVHDFSDTDSQFGFSQVDYEGIQHVPVWREAWVLSLRARVQTTFTKSDQEIPFFMLPALGGGSSLRGFNSWRFRDRNSLLLQAEWRVMVNRFFETALFYDAGEVTARTGDLDFTGLKDDYGIGIRFHGPLATPLRIDFAKSNEGLHIVFAASAVF
jgi:surface antigen Omp85-like protein